MILRQPLHNDGILDIVKYVAKPNEVFSLSITAPITTATINKYIIYTAGTINVFNEDGELVLSRTAGDSTDSNFAALPAGIHYFECDDEKVDFYSITKVDGSRVNRKEHRLAHNTEIDIVDPCALFIATGYIDVPGLGNVLAPYVLVVTEPVHLTAIDDSFIVELT